MFEDIIDFSSQGFAILVIFLSLGVATHLSHGFGTKQAKEMTVGLLFLLMVAVQMYYLLMASLYMPASRFQVLNPSYVRVDCRNPTKGGKRRYGTRDSEEYRNPCWCHRNAKCRDSDGNTAFPAYCPYTFQCYDGQNFTRLIDQFSDNKRNCKGGMGLACTKDEPCFPCEPELLANFVNASRCTMCQSADMGYCNFIPDLGPYCLVKAGSKEITPCKRCCSDPTPVFIDGKCY